MNTRARGNIHKPVKWATIVFAWLCWVAALFFRNWWFVLLGFVPYLLWNQVGRRPAAAPTEAD